MQGGDYADIIEAVKDTIHAWRSVGLEPVFLWDGPMPLVKQPVYIARRAHVAAANSAFMRSSPAARASKTFQVECCGVLPLLGDAVQSALLDLRVENIMVQTEADGAVAEHAEQRAGLAASKDSDFFILCARGASKARYTPVDSFEYIVEFQQPEQPSESAGQQDAETIANGDEDGFEVATSRRKRNRNRIAASTSARDFASTQVLSKAPPRSNTTMTLKSVRLRAYSSHELAAQLKLPPSLLPLLGSIVGNDYSTPVQETVLFRHLNRLQDRIQNAAEVVRIEWQRTTKQAMVKQAQRSAAFSRTLEGRLASKSLLGAAIEDDTRSEYSTASSATATPGAMTAQPYQASTVSEDPVQALVHAAVNNLLERADVATQRVYYISDSEKEACIESIIESMAAYSLLTNVSSSLLAESSTFFHRTIDDRDRQSVLERYRSAFEACHFPVKLVSALSERSAVMTIFPEDPDQKSVHVGAARDIRRWVYAILFSIWGMDWARETMEEPRPPPVEDSGYESDVSSASSPSYEEGQSPDDVISVDTESESEDDEDGAELWHSADSFPTRPGSVFDSTEPLEVKPPPAVQEYVRKGDRLVGELVKIDQLPELLKQNEDHLPASLTELHGQHLAFGSTMSASQTNGEPSSEPAPTPAPLLPLDTRFDLYRLALHSSDETFDSVPRHLLHLVASLRHIIASIAEEHGESKKRLSWTLPEVKAALYTGVHISAIHQARKRGEQEGSRILDKSHWVNPSSRGIHLSTTLQLVMESAHLLSCSLFLSPDELPSPYTLFDGPLFQYLVANEAQVTKSTGISKQTKTQADQLLAVILGGGHEDDLAIDLEELKRRRKQAKKNKKVEEEAAAAEQSRVNGGGKGKDGQKKGANGSNVGKNAFELLMG